MSHSFHSGDITIIHNSDLSGDVRIVKRIEEDEFDEACVTELELPGKALIEFVGQYFAMEAISEIEQMTGAEFLASLVRREKK